VNTQSFKTVSANENTVERKWYVVDAEGQSLGRLASNIAQILRGKNKPYYTPHVDCGDYIVVINAEKVRLTGNKMSNKLYLRYSGYPGGQKKRTAEQMLEKNPISLVETAVKGMLPKNRLGRQMFKKLFAYAGAEHKHAAQQPEELKF